MKAHKIGLMLAASLVASSQPALAQATGSPEAPSALPDPARIETPAVASDDPKVLNQGYKFFYFYNPEVSFSQAVADVAECRSFMRHGVFPPQSGFVPWVEPANRKIPSRDYYNPYGLVGSLMAAVIVPVIMPKINRGLDNNIVRRCMEPRGYKRYPLPEDSWKAMNEGKDERQNILMQAKLASGAKPVLPEVTEK